MILRILQIAIVLAWLGSTTVLIQRTYFPDEERYPEADAKEVAELFFEQAKSTDLAILRNGRQIGRMNLNPRSGHSKSPITWDESGAVREIFFSGFLTEKTEPGEISFGQMSWNGSVFLDSDMKLSAVRLGGRVPQLATGQVQLSLYPPNLTYEIRQGREIAFSSNDPEKTRRTLEEFSQLLGEMPIDLGILDQDSEQLGQLLAMVQPTVDCRHGQFRIFEDRYHGFIISLSLLEEWKVRVFLSELGELLKIDGIPDLLILGEAFVPQDIATAE